MTNPHRMTYLVSNDILPVGTRRRLQLGVKQNLAFRLPNVKSSTSEVIIRFLHRHRSLGRLVYDAKLHLPIRDGLPHLYGSKNVIFQLCCDVKLQHIAVHGIMIHHKQGRIRKRLSCLNSSMSFIALLLINLGPLISIRGGHTT